MACADDYTRKQWWIIPGVHTIYALTFAGLNFHGLRVFTFAVAESQAKEIKPCVSFHKAKLSRMVADP